MINRCAWAVVQISTGVNRTFLQGGTLARPASPHQIAYDAACVHQSAGRRLRSAGGSAIAPAQRVAHVGHLVVKVRAHTPAPQEDSLEWVAR
eukprot:1599005-Amphidinium_carterae.1